MKRFRVRAASKTYKEPGPDLLRPESNAVQQLGKNMGSGRAGWYTRRTMPEDKKKWSSWSGPIMRSEALQRADAFMNSQDGHKFQVGRKKGKVTAKAEMLVKEVKEVALDGTHPGAELVADLARAQFNCNVGGFNCREYNGVPGSGWSDHAWGDAVDLVTGGGSPGKNDVLTDWCVRMARAGCMGDVQQFIGSNGGRVYSFIAPSYAANLGGPVSHLTHVHSSYRQHFGADPNCR